MPPKKKILAVDDDATALGRAASDPAPEGIRRDDGVLRRGGAAASRGVGRSTSFILDVAMPGMSGFDLCRRIREIPATKDTPVVFLTAKGLLMDMAEGQDAGSDLYLIKPVLAAKLLSMVGLFLTADGALARRRGPEPTP